jgi:hypothetical protein
VARGRRIVPSPAKFELRSAGRDKLGCGRIFPECYTKWRSVVRLAERSHVEMSTHHKLIQSLTGSDEMVWQFFVTFSRFEYALKRAGFVKGDSYDNALPDWGRFAREKLNAQIADITDAEFTKARSYLLQEPPRRQTFVKSNKSMQWRANSKRSSEGEGEYLLRLVRDARNNLFHGGKYPSPDGPVNDQTLRNSQLLQACLTILEKCRLLDGAVKHFFEEHE